MYLYNQYLIPTNLQPCNTTSGLEQLPTQLNAQWNCLSPFQPYQPLYQYHPYSHLRLACRCLEWRRAWSGVGAESKKGKWAEQLGRRWEKKSTFSQCLRMVVKDGEGFCAWDTILFFSIVGIAFRWNIPGVIFSILRQFMSPNLVSQQLISDQNSTLPPNMPISTFEASMVNCQWSMVKTFFHTLNGSVQSISYPHKFTAMQHHSGLEQLPTQLNAQWNCLSPFQPYQPLYQYHPYSHLRLACRCLEWRRAWSGVGAESKKGKWAEQLGRRWEKKSTFSQCLRMVVKDGEGFCAWDTILFFSLVRIAFRWNIPGVIFSILRQFMSPNLVSQQLISDRNSTLQSNMPISTFEASMVNCQWSQWSIRFSIH